MNPTERFSNRASDYVAGRPQYPAAAIEALVAGLGDPHGLDVADLGAGTGISSRALAERGCRVVAVEPNAAMRACIEETPTLRTHDGTAEHTGLTDASFDLVTAFQAFHWFAAGDALREFVRIARPRGRAALVYNTRDDSDAATYAYTSVVRAYASDRGKDARRRTGGLEHFRAFTGFANVHESTFANEQRLDLAGLRARALSTSYLPKEGPHAATLQADLDALFQAHERDGFVTMCMNTVVTIASVR